MTAPFQGKTFQTAARRRNGTPLVFKVEHWGPSPEDGSIGPLDVELRIDPMVDTVRVGAAFGGFGSMLTSFNDDDIPAEEKLARLDRALPQARKALRDCLVPHDRALYDSVVECINVSMIGELVQWMTQELSGLDPTKRASSSDGSVPTGSPSTDGAPLEE